MLGKLQRYFIEWTSMPSSSLHSRSAADSAVSSGSQKPPGNARKPLRGSFARFSKKTQPFSSVIISPTAAATLL